MTMHTPTKRYGPFELLSDQQESGIRYYNLKLQTLLQVFKTIQVKEPKGVRI